MTGPEFDVAVIGAGINGAGVAREATLRGLAVVVFDKGDLCSGTSAWSSRLIHGGLRYLEYGELPLVYESLHERRTLCRIAPHLVHPLPITIPVYAGARRGPWLVRLGMLAYDLLSLGKTLPRHEMLSRDELEAAAPGIALHGLSAAARYYDAQVNFAERLVLENLLAAAAAGGEIRTWHEVESLRIVDGRVDSLAWRNELTGEAGECRARIVVNAAGPWVDRVLERVRGGGPRANEPAGAKAPPPRLIGGTKGSHVVVGRFAGAPDGAIYVEAAADGRPIFIIPWNHLVLIGTTDSRFDGDPGSVRASREEVDYLLGETNRVFPGAHLGPGEVHYAYAGVRPLPYRDARPESAITRKHIIHHDRDTAANLLSIIGGKLTTYRSLSEQVVDRVARLLRRRVGASRTADTPLPGGHGLDEATTALVASGVLSQAGVRRLLTVYGGRARHVLRIAEADAAEGAALDQDRTVLAAEVSLACRHEYAATLVDIVFRRTMTGLAADQGRGLYAAMADVAARELGWDESRRAAELAALVRFADSLRLQQ
ncbi:MAG TPA: glycerol-3-phosphate dehydrogenase [Woeseiaceae bacterium]|nr:glycerol-3-phosphate dehydrogenase [Woeseiaceae bacterium]